MDDALDRLGFASVMLELAEYMAAYYQALLNEGMSDEMATILVVGFQTTYIENIMRAEQLKKWWQFWK